MKNGFFLSASAVLLSAALSAAQPPTPSASKSPYAPDYGPPPAALPGPNTGPAPGVPCPGDACPSDVCPSPHPDCCEPCGPAGRAWVDADYLLWWISGRHSPALVSTGPAGTAGILDRPGASALFGGDRSTVDGDLRSGLRVGGGFWLDDCHTMGLELGYFYLAPGGDDFAASGTGAPGSSTVSRPFINAITGRADSELVALPGVASGSIFVSTSSRLEGADANGVYNLACDCGFRLDALLGFRYLKFDENIDVAEDPAVLPNVPIIGGTQFFILDRFDVRNDFYGGQVGLRAEVRRGRLIGQFLGKLALGDMHEVVDVNGSTRIVSATGVVNARGGLLAAPTNMGHYTRDEFAVVPEVGLRVGYQLTDHMRALVGYSFLYASSVARAADQIDPVVNPSQLPSNVGRPNLIGPARPAFQFHDSDFWAQGVNFGLEFRY